MDTDMDMDIDLPLAPPSPSYIPPGGLPYDGPSIASRLDAELPSARPEQREREEVGERTKALMGRMSEHRIYTLEENGGVLFEPVVKDDEDDEEIDLSFLESSPHPLRPTTLHLSGPPVAHLPTPLLFTYTSLHLPASPIGVEWIDDTSCLLLFPTERDTYRALRWLSKTGFDAENDDPVAGLPAWGVPAELFPALPSSDVEETTADEPIGREAYAAPAPAPKPKKIDPSTLPEGLRPGARLNVRYGLLTDLKARKPGRESKFYQTYGRGVGSSRGQGGRRGEREGDRGRIELDLDRELDAPRKRDGGLQAWNDPPTRTRHLDPKSYLPTSDLLASTTSDWKKARDVSYGGYEDVGGSKWGRDGAETAGWEKGPDVSVKGRGKKELLEEGGEGLLGRLGPAMDRERERSPKRWSGREKERERERSPRREERGARGREGRDSGRTAGRGKREVKDQAALDRELDEFLGRS